MSTRVIILLVAAIVLLSQLVAAQARNPYTETYCSDYCSVKNGLCVNTNNNYTKLYTSCYCRVGYTGPNCTVLDARNNKTGVYFNHDCNFYSNANFTLNETNKFCGCNLGYGGPNCNLTCSPGYCGPGTCYWYNSAFWCKCPDLSTGVLGDHCEFNLYPAHYTFHYALYAVLIGICYFLVLFYTILLVYTQTREWLSRLSKPSLGNDFFERLNSKLPSLTNVSTLNFLFGIACKCMYFILYWIKLGIWGDVGDFRYLEGAGYYYTMNVFRLVSTMALIICNVMIIFKWFQICLSTLNLSSKISMSWKQKVLFIILTIIMYGFFILFLVLFYSNVTTFDLVALYFAILAIIIPIGFLVTGLYMYSVLKAANTAIDPFGLKFMRFLIALYIITILIVVFAFTQSILGIFLNPFNYPAPNYVGFYVMTMLVEWVARALELAAVFLFCYLLFEAKHFKAYVFCCFYKNSEEGAQK